MKKIKFFGAAILVALAVSAYVSANTSRADANVLLSRTEALTDCEASTDECADGSTIQCSATGIEANCSSTIIGTGEYKKLMVLCTGPGNASNDACDIEN